MGRKKQNMGMIDNKKVLNRTFINRRRGILKKASELSTLCDVQVGVIMFGPKDIDEAPEVWPKEPDKLNNVIRRYLDSSVEQRRKKATNLSSFIKKEGTLSKFDDVNKDNNKVAWDARIDEFSVDELVGLVNCLESKIGAVDQRIKMMKKSSVFGNVSDVDQEVQSCVSGDQGNNMMMMMMMMNNMPSLGFDDHDHQSFDLDDGQMAADDEELMTMMMMMMDGGDACYPSNDNVGDFSGLIGMQQGINEDYSLIGGEVMRENVKEEEEGLMWMNPTPMSWYCDPVAAQQLQAQAQAQTQLNGGQLLPYY